MRTQSLRRCAVLAVAITKLLGDASSSRAGDASKPVDVKVTRPSRGEIIRYVTLPGEVRAYQQAALYSKVAGYLKTITVDKGDEVKEGALIADIEVPELLADRVKYKAEVEVAAIEYQRLSESLKKSPDLVVPQTVDTAKGKLDVAKANLERIETLLGFAKITAPFSGVVTKRMADPGAFIPVGGGAQNAAIVTLMDFSKVRVQVAVPEIEAALVREGQPVKLSVDGLPGRLFEGKVTRQSYALDDATKTMLVESDLPNPDAALRPGMYATVKIGLERHTDALTMPIEALVMEKLNAFTFVANAGKAKKTAIKIGFNDGARVEVISGLTGGEAVILVGKMTLADGAAVNAMEAR